MKYSHSFRATTEDIDEQGHVNNVTYVRGIQDVAVAHWLHATGPEQQAEVFWVVLRHEVDYKKPAFEAEQITASTWVGNWTAVTCERFTEIHRGADLLVTARTVWCMLDRRTGRPARITPELKALFR